MNPVWTLFSRRAISRLAYWLSALGYNLSDRSISNRIYLVYFCAFWTAWAIAVFTLLGNIVVDDFFVLQNYFSPPRAVIMLSEYALAIWVLFRFWQVSRRSPLVFSEGDAYLLCQTPVKRRDVGLVWFFEEAIRSFIPFALGAVILSFALVEWQFRGEGTFLRIPTYLTSSLRALLLILMLQNGLLAVLWGIGAMRLHRRGEPLWMKPAFLGVLLLFLVGFLLPSLHRFFLSPLRMMLFAAFSQPISIPAVLVGVGIGCVFLALAWAFFYAQSRDINLSLAAQETSHLAVLQLARSYWQFDLVDVLQQRQRLGATRAESRLLDEHSRHVLMWKDLLQSMRTFRLRKLLDLAWIFGLSLGMFTGANWGFQLVMGGIWATAVGSICVRRLHSDLARWWLLRLLPLQPGKLLRDELLLSLGACTLVSEAALLFSNLPDMIRLYAAILMPVLVVNAALASSHDILRRSEGHVLMSPSLAEENVPRQDIWGILQGLISVLIPFGILIWLQSYLGQPLLGLVAFPVAILITWLNYKLMLSAYRWIK